MAEEDQEKSLESSFLNSDFSDPSYSLGSTELKKQLTSDYKNELYKSLTQEDKDFEKFIKTTYGSKENYFKFIESMSESRIYDPQTDYFADVLIKTKNYSYKLEYISKNEVIMELLSGICSVEYTRKNGNSDKIVGTLSSSYIPDSESDTRLYGFGGLGPGRILMWDTVKGGWSSFYMSNIIRFVRDETSGLE